MFRKSRENDDLIESWRHDDLGRRIRQDLQSSYGQALPSDQVWQRLRQNLAEPTCSNGPNLIVWLVHRPLFTLLGPVVLLAGIMVVAGFTNYGISPTPFSQGQLSQAETQYPHPVIASYEVWLDKSPNEEGGSVHRIVTYEQWEGSTESVSSDSPSFRERLAWGR
ncbi:MAG: hypothetical protein HY326_05290 [Chloroflexi bacterium]|nr:hypothetical protein [Chloroflexota bacterium]